MTVTVNDRMPSLVGTEVPHAADEALPRTVARAWELILPQKDAERLVGGWVIYAPFAHPLWSYYTLEIITLKDGLQPPIQHWYVEGATHEFVLWALQPDHVPILDGPNRVLEPKNFAAQFVEQSDEHARVQLKHAVQDVIDGRLSPDTDFIGLWKDRFGDQMVRGINSQWGAKAWKQ